MFHIAYVQAFLLLTYQNWLNLSVSFFYFQMFFILRKKFSHVTFLHVYHHTGMVLGGYVASRFCAAGHGTMLGLLNCMQSNIIIYWIQINVLILSLHFQALCMVSCTDIILLVRSMKMWKNQFGGKNISRKFSSHSFSCWVSIFRCPFSSETAIIQKFSAS